MLCDGVVVVMLYYTSLLLWFVGCYVTVDRLSPPAPDTHGAGVAKSSPFGILLHRLFSPFVATKPFARIFDKLADAHAAGNWPVPWRDLTVLINRDLPPPPTLMDTKSS